MKNKQYVLMTLEDVSKFLENYNTDIESLICSNTPNREAWTSNGRLSTTIKGLSEAFDITGARHFEDICVKYKLLGIDATESDQNSEILKKIILFAINWGNIINFTYEKYSILASLYDSSKNDLLLGIKSTMTGSSSGNTSNTQNYNDTPQNENNNEIFGGDDYSSSINKSNGASSATATETRFDERELLIDRLEKIGSKYEKVILNWSNEFNKLFIFDINYEGEDDYEG